MKKRARHPLETRGIVNKTIDEAENERRELRFTYSLNEFSRGNLQVLKNDEFWSSLEGYLLSPTPDNKDKQLQLLLLLCKGILSEEEKLKERASALLSSATGYYLQKSDKAVMFLLANGLCNWLEFETEILPGFTVLCRRLEEVLAWLMRRGYWLEAEQVILLLHRIGTDRLKKSKAIKSLTNKILQNLGKKAIVEDLTDLYLLEDDHQLHFQNILMSIGPKAAVYLLNRVVHSHSRPERLVLLGLIASFGSSALPALEDCLNSGPPWSVVRNVIYIVSEIGMDANFSLVEKYFSHPDERVQHEMIRCILKLGGLRRHERLLAALKLVHDRLKIYVLRLLVEQAEDDKDILPAILELAQEGIVHTVQSGYDLLLAIVAALKNYPCRRGIDLLEKMQVAYMGQNGTDELLLHIGEALKIIRPQLRHSLQNGDSYQDSYQDEVSFDSDPVEQQLAQEKVRKIEEELQVLLAADDVDEASKIVFNQAVAAAKTRDFAVAGLMRDRLLEINPMALAEAIQLGEYIDGQKSSSVSSHHLEIWSELYEEMNSEEFNELYCSLRQENYHKNDIIVQSGETDNTLYFLNSGHISLCCSISGKEVFLKRMQPGDVLGGDQFFSPSVWTVTLKALGPIQVHVLDHSVLKKVSKIYPDIEEKLRNYCEKYSQIPELLKMSGDDRREYPRHVVALQTKNVLLDPYSNKGRREFRGELLDISKKGLAFTIRISTMENARLLLGRHLMTTVLIGDELIPRQTGVVVGVRIHDEEMQDFSVHVKLAKKIDDKVFKKLIAVAG